MTRGRVQDVGVATAAVGGRQDGVVCEIVCAAAAEHKGVNAHSHVASLRLDAFPDKHARAVHAVYRTWFRADLVAWNVRGRAEFRFVFVIGMERYTCTLVERTFCRYMLVRKVVQVGTVFAFEEDKWKEMQIVTAVLPGRQQFGYVQVLSADSRWYGHGEVGIATFSVRRNGGGINSSTCATFLAKVRYGKYLCNIS